MRKKCCFYCLSFAAFDDMRKVMICRLAAGLDKEETHHAMQLYNLFSTANIKVIHNNNNTDYHGHGDITSQRHQTTRKIRNPNMYHASRHQYYSTQWNRITIYITTSKLHQFTIQYLFSNLILVVRLGASLPHFLAFSLLRTFSDYRIPDQLLS